MENATETRAPDFGSSYPIHWELGFPGLDWMAHGNWESEDSCNLLHSQVSRVL